MSERGWMCPAAGGGPCSRLPWGRWRRVERSEDWAAFGGARGRGPKARGCVAGRAWRSRGAVWRCLGTPHPRAGGCTGLPEPGAGLGVDRGFPGGVGTLSLPSGGRGRRVMETPGSQGRPGCGRRPDPAERSCFSSQGWLWKGSREALCEEEEARRCAECFFFRASGKC